MEKRFNFNNEADILTIEVADDGRVTIPSIADSPTFDSVEEFAERYAAARNVDPEHLKNWQLIENGDVISFVLRAGTAGVEPEAIAEELESVYAALTGYRDVHPLDIARLKTEITNSDDVMTALAMASVPNVARIAYDLLVATGAFAEDVGNVEAAEPEDVETRSPLEILLDDTMDRVGSIAIYAQIVNLPITATKEEVLYAMENNVIRYTPESLSVMYHEVLQMVRNGRNINSERDVILVVTQAPVGVVDDELKAKMKQIAMIARRTGINITTAIVGQHNIKHTATYVSLDDLETMEVFNDDGKPVIYRFDPSIDAEFEIDTDEDESGSEDDEYYDADDYDE